MRCTTCERIATMLIRNRCETCAPEVFMRVKVAKQAFDRLYEKYRAQTGKEAIEAWTPFVEWAALHEPDDWAAVNGRCA